LDEDSYIKTRVIFVPLHNFHAYDAEDIKQMLRILSYLSECLSIGVYRVFEKLPTINGNDTSLLASTPLNHYTSTPCWDILAHVKKNQKLYIGLDKPIGIFIRGQAIEMVFDRYISTDFRKLDNEIRTLASLVGSLIFGYKLESITPIIAILKIIECSETKDAKILGKFLSLYQIADGLFVGPKKIKKDHIPDQVFSFYSSGWSDIYLASSKIVYSPNSTTSYPLNEILPSVIMTSLCAAELHNLSTLIPQVITEIYTAGSNMPILFRNLFKTEPIVKRWIRFNDESILELTSEFTKVMKRLETNPDGEVARSFWKVHSEVHLPRLNELAIHLDQNVNRLLHNITTLLARKNPPIKRALTSFKLFKPYEMILNDLKDLRREIPSFKKPFQEQVSNAISNAKLEVALHGILISLGALIIGVSIDILTAFPSLLQIVQNFVSVTWPLSFLLFGLLVSILVGFVEVHILIKASKSRYFPKRLAQLITRLLNRR